MKDGNLESIKKDILNHKYTLTSYVLVNDDSYEIILLLVNNYENMDIDLLSSYKNDLVLKGIIKKDILKWVPYQNKLKKLVKDITNYTFDKKLKLDIKDYFLEYLNLTNEELDQSIIKRANDLARIFREEAYLASKLYQKRVLRQENREDIYEKSKICKACHGKCCLDGACDYLVSDIEYYDSSYIKYLLDNGMASIKADFYKMGDKLNLLLLLKARNVNHGKIDLISIESKCAHLTTNGCALSYNNRPGMAKHLIPDNLFNCFNDLDINKEYIKWLKYQDILEKYLFLETGLTLEQEFKKEVLLLFQDVLKENFKDISINSINEAKELVNYLKLFYEEEYQMVVEDFNRNLKRVKSK